MGAAGSRHSSCACGPWNAPVACQIQSGSGGSWESGARNTTIARDDDGRPDCATQTGLRKGTGQRTSEPQMVYSVPLGCRSQSDVLVPAHMPWSASIGARQGHLIPRDTGVMACGAFRQDAGSTQHSRPTRVHGSGWTTEATAATWGGTIATIPGESMGDATRAPAWPWWQTWCGLGGMARMW